MQLSPSSEDASLSGTQEVIDILWNPKVHYLDRSNLSLVPILGQINPVHTTPFYYSETNLDIILQPSST
jgi:hypothetical protein